MIQTPSSEIVLPTKNMVREALFSILGRSVVNAAVLDLFAGSGALGLEALSRGASKAFFCDSHPEPIRILTDNIKTLKEEGRAEVHHCDYNEMINYLENNEILVDITFVDPPYESGYYDAVIERMLASKAFKSGGKIIIESRHEIANYILKNHESRQYRYGQTHLLIVTK
jgi:16S rRNA (guanine(966)-N(2))-methyltransferase RsmD